MTSPSQVNLFFDYLDNLNQGRKFHIIIDLSETKPPSADVRSELRGRFKLLSTSVLSYKVYVGKNVLLKIAVKFVGASIGLENFTVHSSVESAKLAIQNEAKS